MGTKQLDWAKLADAGLGWPEGLKWYPPLHLCYGPPVAPLEPGYWFLEEPAVEKDDPYCTDKLSDATAAALWRDHAVRFLLANGVGINTSVPAGQQGPVVEPDKFEWMLYRAVEQRLKAEVKL